MEQSKLTSSTHLNISAAGAIRPAQRKTNVLHRVFFPNTAWFLFLLLPFIAIGFWPGYWSKLPGNIGSVIHVHNALMMAWVLMSLAQPLLIMKKKITWHRLLGKISYVLMPLVLVSGYFLIQERYVRKMGQINADVASGKVQLTTEQVYSTAATSLRLGLVYFLLLTVLYTLAVIYRKRFLHHATFMLGAILTAVGPSLGRILGQVYKANGVPMNFWSAYSTELFTLLLLGALAVYQKRKGHSLVPVLVTIGAYAGAVWLLEVGAKTPAWQALVEALFTA